MAIGRVGSKGKQMKGFILSDNIIDGPQGMTIEYWVKTEKKPVKLVITTEKPIFFVERRAEVNLGRDVERKQLGLKSFNGAEIDGLYFKDYRSLLNARESLSTSGVRTYESDVRPNERFLMERFISGGVDFSGEVEEKSGVSTMINPKMQKSEVSIPLSTLSFDIETSLGDDLYSIGTHHVDGETEFKRVHIIGDLPNTDEVHFHRGEREVILAFINDLRKLDPDIICGWHVVGFDLVFLEKKCRALGIKFTLGRDGSEIRIVERKGSGYFADIAGRVVFDGPWLLKQAFHNFENYKLDTVANEVLGVGKDIESTGSDKVSEITRRFHEDKMALAKYNLLDCTLVLDIYKKLNIVDHYVKRIMYSGMLMDRISSSAKAFDHIYLPLIHRKGLVANNVIDTQKDASSLGGYVMEGIKGLHDHVIVLDFKSLYPTIIKTFKIDPYSRLKGDINTLTTVNGVNFSKTEHILPGIIDGLLNLRSIAKHKKDANLSQAVKILMNSFYGVMGSGGCRFYHADLPQSITQTGQWLLKETISYIEENGHKVVYGDTDSLFIKLNFLEIGARDRVGKDIATKVNAHLDTKIKSKFGIESFLEIEYEKYFSKLFIPESRLSEKGAKKRYVGLLENENSAKLHFSGMEFVRSDWTKLAKNFQFELITKFFADEKVEEFIKDYVARLKSSEFDNLLVYKKRLSKPVDEYIKTVPPHVKAAKLLLEKNPKLFIKDVSYLMTFRGPVPEEFSPTDIDYQHYIDKQIAPLATDVLKFLNLSFDDIISGSQMSLF